MTCRLSPSQQRASTLAAEGKSNREIAFVLGLHVQTVKNYLSAAMRRVGARNRIELAVKLREMNGNGDGTGTVSDGADRSPSAALSGPSVPNSEQA
jgi:DNA-binding CsgD family transcriptional regulator